MGADGQDKEEGRKQEGLLLDDFCFFPVIWEQSSECGNRKKG